MTERRIVTVALLTREETDRVGPLLGRAWPIEDSPCFAGLLQAIDEADRQLWRERDQVQMEVSSPVQTD